MISYVISLMKACLHVRAFAWKEVSTETLPDSCPDPLLFLLFSRRFPALSLLLGLLRFHQIEQLLFRVDLKPGIEMPRMRRPGQHVLRALLRQPGLFRRPCPWLRRTWATSSTNFWAKPRNFAFCDTPLLTPPIQEKTSPRVGLFFIACKWALRV